MDKSTLNVAYVVSLILIMLSLAIIGNAIIAKDIGDNFRGTGSTMLASLIIPNEKDYKGTLLERYCYEHNQYFGVRS